MLRNLGRRTFCGISRWLHSQSHLRSSEASFRRHVLVSRLLNFSPSENGQPPGHQEAQTNDHHRCAFGAAAWLVQDPRIHCAKAPGAQEVLPAGPSHLLPRDPKLPKAGWDASKMPVGTPSLRTDGSEESMSPVSLAKASHTPRSRGWNSATVVEQ